MSGGPSRRETLHLLSSVSVAGLAGCMSAGPGLSGDDTTPQSNGGGLDLTTELSLSVTVLQSFSRDHPGRIEVTLGNHSDDPLAMGTVHGIEGPLSIIEGDRTDSDGKLIIFGDPPGETHETPPGAPCRSDAHAVPETPTDGCWQPACEYSKLHSHYAITVPADSSLVWPYVVLDGFNDLCLPAGTYEFVETTPFTPLQTSTLEGTTPAGGWSTHISKHLQLTLESDGALTAEAFLGETS